MMTNHFVRAAEVLALACVLASPVLAQGGGVDLHAGVSRVDMSAIYRGRVIVSTLYYDRLDTFLDAPVRLEATTLPRVAAEVPLPGTRWRAYARVARGDTRYQTGAAMPGASFRARAGARLSVIEAGARLRVRPGVWREALDVSVGAGYTRLSLHRFQKITKVTSAGGWGPREAPLAHGHVLGAHCGLGLEVPLVWRLAVRGEADLLVGRATTEAPDITYSSPRPSRGQRTVLGSDLSLGLRLHLGSRHARRHSARP